MSDLKAALTETLREALASEHPFNGGTFPRWFRVWINEASEKAADALLGLPGVAVTQLPELDHVQPGDEFENGRTDYALGDVSVFEDGEIHLFGAVWQLSDVKSLAAALLAAALSVEGNTNA